MDINIASLKAPRDAMEFLTHIHSLFPTITAGVVADGFGCLNYGFRIETTDEEAELIANELAMAMMPAKWAGISNDPMLKAGEFYDARTN